MGPQIPSGTRVSPRDRACILARMSHIEDLYSSRPETTILDVELFVLGWVRAEELLTRTQDTYLDRRSASGTPTPSYQRDQQEGSSRERGADRKGDDFNERQE